MNCFFLKIKLKKRYVKELSLLIRGKPKDLTRVERKALVKTVKTTQKINSKLITIFFKDIKSLQKLLNALKSKEKKITPSELKGLLYPLNESKKNLKSFIDDFIKNDNKK